ncbi:MAG: 3-deoxy-D-manno-octulosonic acid transferase [Planctomycetota bacterium]
MPPLLVDILYIPLAILYLPILLYQMIVLKKNRRGWRQRLGLGRRRFDTRPCVWIHAVSLGEVNATRSLVSEIEKRLPAYDIVISATTDTGYAAACAQYTPKHVFRYPLDFSCVVGRTLDRIRPNAIVLMELEVWPNLVTLACRRGVPILIANGRVTEERSMRRFRMPFIRWLARRMFGRITCACAQNETYASRFEELGVPCERVFVTGTMKYDTALVADSIPGDEALALAMGIDRERPLFVAGSTGPGEEEMILRAYGRLKAEHPRLQLAIIPRKPERFEEVAKLIGSAGYVCTRRSRRPDLDSQDARTARRQAESSSREGRGDAVFLGDTMGELRKFYSLAAVVFVGRSLMPMGGSDLMEVAGLGRAMCFGPHVENFSDVAEKLLAAEAGIQLQSAEELAPTLDRLLRDPENARRLGPAAQEVVRQNVGATSRTVDLLCESLGMRADHPESSISTEQLAC